MKNLLIVPTRSRPHNAAEFYDSFIQNTSDQTTLCFAIDSDDAQNYSERYDNVIWEVNDRKGMNGTLNLVANKYSDQYDYITFMGDDHRIRTSGWDKIFMRHAKKNTVSYGNDLIQGESLATAAMLDSNIIRTLGYMAPPKMKHLYLDNFWMELGRRLNTLQYYSDVIIEHMHYSVGKSNADELYEEVNSAAMNDNDKIAWEQYLMYNIADELNKFKVDM
jgi:hypothetical protein